MDWAEWLHPPLSWPLSGSTGLESAAGPEAGTNWELPGTHDLSVRIQIPLSIVDCAGINLGKVCLAIAKGELG